jgi:WD40 repeat protein
VAASISVETRDGTLLIASGAQAAACSPDGERLAIAMKKGVATWRRTGGAWRQEWSAGALVAADADEDAPDVVEVAFAPEGRHLASGDKSGLIHLWDLVDGELRLLIDHGDWITGLAFAPDGPRLATAGEDGVVRLWDVPDGRARLDVKHGGPITGLTFSADGRRFASAGRDRTVRVWDAETGVTVLELEHPCTVWDVAFSPDGRRLATAARDRSVRLWDEAGGETMLMRHGWSLLWGRSVLRVAFSPDGGVVASAGCDKTVRMWNAETGTPLLEIGHEGPVDAVAFAPDGTQLVTASFDVRLWDTTERGPGAHLGVRTRSAEARLSDAVAILLLAAFGLGVVVISVLVVAALVKTDVDRGADGAIVDAGVLSLAHESEVQVGDCLVDHVPWLPRLLWALLEEGDLITGVPCEDPHDHEVFAMAALPELFDPASVDEAVLAAGAEALCDARFAEYVGLAIHRSELTYRSWWPSVESWTDGDRTVWCWLSSSDGSPLMGSMQHTSR